LGKRERRALESHVKQTLQDIFAEVITANLAEAASDFERDIRTPLIRAALEGAMISDELKTRLLAQILRTASNGAATPDIRERFAKVIRD